MSYELGDPTFDARTGIAGGGSAVAVSARRSGNPRGGLGDPTFDPRTGLAGATRGPKARGANTRPYGWSGGAAFGDPTFDPRTGIAGAASGGTAAVARARRAGAAGLRGYNDLAGFDTPAGRYSAVLSAGSGLRGYNADEYNPDDYNAIDEGLGRSNRFKFNKKSFTRPLKSVRKYAPLAVAFVPLPGGSLFTRGRQLFNKGKTIQTQVKQAGLILNKQATPDGGVVVVATNPTTGAVVSKPLPVDPSVVTDAQILPTNAIQAAAPTAAAPTAAAPTATDGILPFIRKIVNDSSTSPSPDASSGAANVAAPSSGGGGGSGGGAQASDDTGASSPGMAPDTGGGGNLLQNPAVLIGGAIVAFLIFNR